VRGRGERRGENGTETVMRREEGGGGRRREVIPCSFIQGGGERVVKPWRTAIPRIIRKIAGKG
jgi:hypothetical protein